MHVQVHLDKHLKLLDSPGIVFNSGASAAASALRNCVKVPPYSAFGADNTMSSMA